ncbi:hypothetical protein F5B19DRAFT_502321 [Rostrohypoxylon terebratum]|nr:hypothetical protein F5B19DRAFT_502321 [Rostrohypoxylon terebratum]
MAATVHLDWCAIQYNDPEDDKTTLRKLYEIKDPIQILKKLDKIAGNLPAETDKDIAGKALITDILSHIKSLCDPDGPNFSEPTPKQYIYRKVNKKPKDDKDKYYCPLNVIDNDAKWRFNGFPISHKETEQRKQFFWAHVDLLGLFFSKLGPAPPAANRYNFFLPLTAVYARWSVCLIKKKFPSPAMFQCTWAEPDISEKKQSQFSLGASLGGFHKKSIGVNLSLTRFNLLNQFRNITEISIKNWKGEEKPWGFDNSQEEFWAFGNCAETYPVLQLLSEVDETTKTYGFALRKAAVDDVTKRDETKSLAYYEDKMLERSDVTPSGDYEHRYLAPPCGNCTHLINVVAQADLTLFTPADQFRDPVEFNPPDN